MADLQSVFSDLIRFETELWNAVDARLRSDCDLPMSQFEPMQVINRIGACRASDVARELSITEGGTSKLVARIEASGYCDRRSNPDDGRSSIIALTPRGERVLREATVVFTLELETWLGAALSPRALEQFSTTLTTLRSRGARTTANGKTPR
jgi:DNA-binding MarR family transcriptional regulator